ncbi:Sensor kinase CckA [bacterium HR33]|nr:Sensor kinase CckA [bacterium HR33]
MFQPQSFRVPEVRVLSRARWPLLGPVVLFAVLAAGYWFATARIAESLRQAGGWVAEAGRQRVLAYRVLDLVRSAQAADSESVRAAELAALDSAVREIEAGLASLSGRSVLGEETSSGRAVDLALEALAARWRDTAMPLVRDAVAEREGVALAELRLAVKRHAEGIDALLGVARSWASGQRRQLYWAHVGFGIGGAGLLLWWVLLLRSRQRRLALLLQSAGRMATGDMETPIAAVGRDDVALMAAVLEALRRKIRESLEERGRFFQLSSSLMCIAGYDGYFKEINAAWERVLGYSRFELLSRPWLEFVHPEDRQATVEAARRLTIEGREVESFENRYVKADGGVVVLRWNVVPSPEERLLYGVAYDVTELRERERAERLAAARYADLVEQAPALICTHDLGGRFLTVNRNGARALGYEVEEVVGRNLKDFVPREFTGDVDRYLARVRERGWDGGYLTLVSKEGSRRVLEYSSVLRREPDLGIYVLGYAQDVTEERDLERQLRQVQKLDSIGRLTAGIAHDFNNILSVITANAELLRRSVPEEAEDLREDIEDMLRAARNGAKMISQLMSFSRRAELRLEGVELQGVVSEAAGMLDRLLPDNIEVRVEVEEGLPPVAADRQAVLQILLNLATNARDAMPEGGVLTLALSKVSLDDSYSARHPWVAAGEYLCLSCSDTGTGMDAETLERVFEPFFTTKPAGKGTGLGLSMVYGLMQQHRGFAHVYSEPGRGTVVKLYFPAGVAVASMESAAQLQSVSWEGRGECILLVEDNELLRRTARRALTKFGYRVLEAPNGQEGLKTWRERRSEVALVLTDFEMPEMGGRELFQAVRAEDPLVPFVFASGYSVGELGEGVEAGGGVRIVQKPWDLEALGRVIRAVLDESARRGSP